MDQPEEPFIVIHGEPRSCPKATYAFPASADVAEQIRKHPECLACGTRKAYTVHERAK